MPSSFESGIVEHDFASQVTIASVSEQLQSGAPVSDLLNLATYPPFYLLSQGLDEDDRRATLDKLEAMHATLAAEIGKAGLILSFATGTIRAKHDLTSERFLDIERLRPPETKTEATAPSPSSRARRSQSSNVDEKPGPFGQPPSPQASDVESDDGSINTNFTDRTKSTSFRSAKAEQVLDSTSLAIVRIQWLYDSIAAEKLLALRQYILLEGARSPRTLQNTSKRRKQNDSGDYIPTATYAQEHIRTPATQQSQGRKRLLLSQETTEEMEAIGQRPIPDWVEKHIKYSCQRSQTQPTQNEAFLVELRLIRHKRILDDLSSEKVRNSYGRAIAAVAAYPYPILHHSELEKLPGCGAKFGRLFSEFHDFGSLSEADEMRHDARLQTLDLFWNIHGIGPHHAKSLYEKGYRTIDSLRYKVWPQLDELYEDDPTEKTRIDNLQEPGLDREQQQGLKFYDDFLERISRDEVERIAAMITRHLRLVTDSRAEAMLVGSYRKGKETSGDVDIVVSHPEEHQTADLVDRLYDSLDGEGWIRAKLKISLAHTHRNQKPVLKSHGGGGSFGALDIALLVWQDINWPTKEQDLAEDPDARNPATCRRVDIIVSPWKSVGCAVLGWSGGITFERDLREYAEKELQLKFDSSGVIDRRSGKVIDIEKYEDASTRAKTIAEAERRVIEGLGLTCFDPKERLTD